MRHGLRSEALQVFREKNAAKVELGDPQIGADFERLLEQRGDNLPVTITQSDGRVETVSATEALARVEEDGHAAAELFDCAGGKPEGET